jgi:opacity protein-like surface antigen
MTTMSWPPCIGTFSRSRTQCWILVGALCLLSQVPAWAEESPAAATPAEGPEIYAAIYALGSLAKNRNLNVGGDELSTTVHNGAGGGYKAGVFPAFAGYVVGIQAESFGLGHSIAAPASMGSSGMQSGKGTLLAWTTMVSLIVQYPGERLKPYAGIGAGWSSSYLVDAQFTKGPVSQAGTLTDTSLALQYLAGLRALVTERVFLFGEYKYFASRYHWSGSLEPSLDLRTHIIAVGVGLAF